jgi:hypothetical protein
MTTPDKAKNQSFPKTVTVDGIAKLSATIYRNRQIKGGKRYVNYTLAYPLLGKLKRQTFADLDLAVAAGQEAIKRMSNDEQRVLELTSTDRDVYLRAKDYVKPFGIELDVATRDHAEMLTILKGIGTPSEAARLLVQQRTKKLPRITVTDAVTKCLAQCRADGKSKVRMHELDHYLTKFADDNNVEVSDPTPGLISQYLTSKEASERTKKNCRDVLSNALKALAKELSIPVIVPSQFNRDSDRDNREPRLRDLRDSGSIEQDADIVGLLHQPDEQNSIVLLNIAKHRQGPKRKLQLVFFKETLRFRTAERSSP